MKVSQGHSLAVNAVKLIPTPVAYDDIADRVQNEVLPSMSSTQDNKQQKNECHGSSVTSAITSTTNVAEGLSKGRVRALNVVDAWPKLAELTF